MPLSATYQAKVEEFCKQWQAGKSEFQLQTSGSTGIPKTVSLSRSQLQASIRATQQALKLTPQMTALVCLNISYIAGQMMLARSIEIGMKMLIVEPSANPLKAIEESVQIDFAAFVPLQLQTILEANLHHRLNRMSVIIVGGAAIGNTLKKQIKALQVPVFSTYGMTETVSHVALQKLNGDDVSDFYELLPRIEATTDDRSCLCLRGDVTNNEWIQTNDVVEFADSTHFRVVGRVDNIINSGGIKIQLEKVEAAIEQIGIISNRYFVWWLTDERLGQKLILLIELGNNFHKNDINIATIQACLHPVLSTYEIPKHIYYIDKFVETPTGKIDKQATVLLIT